MSLCDFLKSLYAPLYTLEVIEHLQHDDPQRVDIDLLVVMGRLKLLWSTVEPSSHVLRLFVKVSEFLLWGCALLHYCQSEVSNLGAIVLRKEDVCWLQVAMDDLLRVNVAQALQDTSNNLELVLLLVEPLVNEGPQTNPRAELHRNVQNLEREHLVRAAHLKGFG